MPRQQVDKLGSTQACLLSKHNVSSALVQPGVTKAAAMRHAVRVVFGTVY